MSTKTSEKESISLKVPNPEADDLAGALGISTERREELCDTIKNIFDDRKNYEDMTGQMKAIAEYTHSHEELAFAMVIYGIWTREHQNHNTPLEALAALLN